MTPPLAMPARRASTLTARALHHPLARPLGALVVLLAVAAVFVPGFLHLEIKEGHLYGNLVDILHRAAPLMLAALGMTLVIATRGIDVSVGAVVAIAGTVACALIGPHGLAIALAAGLGAALLCGVWNGLLVSALGLQPIIATLILMVAGRGLAQLLADGQILTVYEPASFFWLGGGWLLGLPVSLFVVAAVAGVTALLLRRTALGLFIQAVGINPVAARLAGVHTAAVVGFVYAYCSLGAGLAGLLIASNIKSADANNAGLLLELDAILAVTLGGGQLSGGRFSLAGSLIGALILQTLTSTIYALGVPPQVTMVVKAVVVFAVCISQSPVWTARRPA
ncbi:MAG: ABC transporter permease [Methylotenera sp.]|jgi:galactofuranose transport system permease protein|nr:ABC transporter permease [Methylotenera sp.]